MTSDDEARRLEELQRRAVEAKRTRSRLVAQLRARIADRGAAIAASGANNGGDCSSWLPAGMETVVGAGLDGTFGTLDAGTMMSEFGGPSRYAGSGGTDDLTPDGSGSGFEPLEASLRSEFIARYRHAAPRSHLRPEEELDAAAAAAWRPARVSAGPSSPEDLRRAAEKNAEVVLERRNALACQWLEVVFLARAFERMRLQWWQARFELHLSITMTPLVFRQVTTWRRRAARLAFTHSRLAAVAPPAADTHCLPPAPPVDAVDPRGFFKGWPVAAFEAFFAAAFNNTARTTDPNCRGTPHEARIESYRAGEYVYFSQDYADTMYVVANADGIVELVAVPHRGFRVLQAISSKGPRTGRANGTIGSTTGTFALGGGATPRVHPTLPSGTDVNAATGSASLPRPAGSAARRVVTSAPTSSLTSAFGAGVGDSTATPNSIISNTKSKTRDRGTVLATVGQYEIFGESSPLTGACREASAYCVTDCDLFVFSRRYLYSFFSRFDPGFVADAVQRAIIRREAFTRHTHRPTVAVLMGCPSFADAFSDWDPQAVQQLVDAMVPTTFCVGPTGEVDLRSGPVMVYSVGACVRFDATVIPPARHAARKDLHARLGIAKHTTGGAGAAVGADTDILLWNGAASASAHNSTDGGAGTMRSGRREVLPLIRPGEVGGVQEMILGEEIFAYRGWRDVTIAAAVSGDAWVLTRTAYLVVANQFAVGAIATRNRYLAAASAALERPPFEAVPLLVRDPLLRYLLPLSVIRDLWENDAIPTLLPSGEPVAAAGSDFGHTGSGGGTAQAQGDGTAAAPAQTVSPGTTALSVGAAATLRSPSYTFTTASSSSGGGGLHLVVSGAVLLHSPLGAVTLPTHVVAEEAPHGALLVGAVEYGAQSTTPIMYARCASTCEVWTIPISAIERVLVRDYPLTLSALQRDETRRAVMAVFTEGPRGPLLEAVDWPSEVGWYRAPVEEERAARKRIIDGADE
jgi:CRP-like cAMP-binding protein